MRTKDFPLLRVHLSRVLSDLHMGPIRRRAIERLRSTMPFEVEDYEDLHHSALALMDRGAISAAPVVRLLLPVGAPHALFAGMRTAIVLAAQLAQAKDLPLEICHFDRPRSARQKEELAALASELSGISAARVHVRNVWVRGASHPDDIHIATFWETALAAQVASRAGVLDPSRTLYLVQDYEPEFYAGSSEPALCKATYHAGFRLVVNSTPLALYLADREGLAREAMHVFRPELDLAGISRAARARVASPRLRVTFYGRPGNSRNSFQLGVASLRLASRRLADAGFDADFVSVGEKHPDIVIPTGRVTSLGKLKWDEYFDRLAATDILLSFQQTPHPSHPPLDAVASGTFAVMNEMTRSRGGLSSRLLATDSDPVAIADRIVQAARDVRAGRQIPHMDGAFVESLGRPLRDVVSDISEMV